MNMFQDVDAEQLARIFSHYQEALAEGRDSQTREHSASWERVPEKERRRLVAAAHLTLLELSTASSSAASSRKYFAKPGEADWGC